MLAAKLKMFSSLQNATKGEYRLMLLSFRISVMWIQIFGLKNAEGSSWNILNLFTWLSVLSNKTGSRSFGTAWIYADTISIMPLLCVVHNKDEHV